MNAQQYGIVEMAVSVVQRRFTVADWAEAHRTFLATGKTHEDWKALTSDERIALATRAQEDRRGGTTVAATAEVTVKRHIGSVMSPHHGSAHYSSSAWRYHRSGVDPEELLGRPLADGARVRVTVEVLDDPDPGFERQRESYWHKRETQWRAESCPHCRRNMLRFFELLAGRKVEG